MLSELTRLLALVSAPPLGSTTVRHVEVLLLQPQVVMVVVITSTGSVTKRVHRFRDPVDPGLANWAAQYLNEQVVGLDLGSSPAAAARRPEPRPARARVPRAGRRSSPRRSRASSRASTSAARPGCSTSCAPRSSTPTSGCSRCSRRVRRCSRSLSQALDPRRPFVRVGPELDHPALARRRARRRVVRPREPDARRREPARPAAHGLREGDPLGARGRARALPLRRGRSTRTTSGRATLG